MKTSSSFFFVTTKKIDSAFGELTTHRLLSSRHKNLDSVGDFLKKKYATRGFDELVPTISEKIAEIEFSLHQFV